MNDKFNFISPIQLAASKDKLRPVMSCVNFKDGFAYASNGYILIKQSLEYSSVIDNDKLNEKSIHRDSFKEILSYQSVTAKDTGVECTDEEGRKTFFEYFNTSDKVPEYEKIIQEFEVNQVEFIGIDPKLIDTISKAIHGTKANGIKIEFNGISKGMLVHVPTYEDQVCILMPRLLEPELFE